MDNPLYKIGEEVILASKSRPDLNGDYIVVDYQRIGIDDGKYRDPWTGTWVVSNGGWVYKLDMQPRESEGFPLEGWLESALRKKHRPADDEFTADILAKCGSDKYNTIKSDEEVSQ